MHLARNMWQTKVSLVKSSQTTSDNTLWIFELLHCNMGILEHSMGIRYDDEQCESSNDAAWMEHIKSNAEMR